MDLQIGNHSYRFGKLDAFEQFHVARRLAPAVFAMGASAMGALKTGEFDNKALLSSIAPLVGIIAGMSNGDSQFVLDTCLSVCSRQSGNNYAKVFTAGGGLLFDDIDMAVMLRLVFSVIRDNLGNFTDALPTAPLETAPQAGSISQP